MSAEPPSTFRITKLKHDEPAFAFTGLGQFWRGRVYQGAMKGDVLAGLKALEWPNLRMHLVFGWEIRVPRLYAGQRNTGAGRRYLCFSAPLAGPFVLAFEEYVTPELLHALKWAYGWRRQKPQRKDQGESHEEPAADPEQHPPEAAARRLKGPGDGQPGDAPGPEQDSRPPGLEKVRKVRRAPKRKKRR